MSTNAPFGGGLGYPISFTSQELDALHVNGKTGKVNERQLKAMLGPKVMPIILAAYHGILPESLAKTLQMTEVIRVSFPQGKPQKHAGMLLQVLYRFTDHSAHGSYRHVFHFVPDSGGLNGKLYTQTRRYIAK